MHTLTELPADRQAAYTELAARLRALLEGEHDLVANAANMAALLFWSLRDLNWAGFYLVEPGRGACGTAAATRVTVVVPDVHEFPGHIACDSASKSEVVVPIVRDGRLLGVLDLDSPVHARFDAADARGLEALVRIFVDSLGG